MIATIVREKNKHKGNMPFAGPAKYLNNHKA